MRGKWMLFFAVFWLLCSVTPVEAESNIEINVNAPLGGLSKYNAWTRVEVNLAPQETPFHGFVDLTKDKSAKRLHESAWRQQVNIEAGKDATITFDMPSQVLLDDWYVRLTENGQVVQVEKLRLPYPKDGRTIGVVHQGGSAFHFLALQPSQVTKGIPYTIQNLAVDKLPDSAWLYQNLDVLAMGSELVGSLRAEQVNAIRDWVQTGGLLILSAGPGQDEVVEPFQADMPVETGRSGQANLKQAIERYTDEKAIPEGSLAVFNRDLPLFSAKAVGKGRILFVNYDVTAEPLASWQHNSQLWQNVMMQHGALSQLENSPFRDQMLHPFLELSKQIPGVQTPAPVWMVVLWCGYIVVIAPAVYLLLKRKGRRQWAWGVIPVTAVLMTVGIYLFGKPLVVKSSASYEISEVQIVDEQLAQTRTAATFLAVDQNQYDIDGQSLMVALPLSMGKNDYVPEGITAGNQLISFRNVPYLTPKQAIGFGTLRDAGSFTAHLTVNADRLQGSVTNHTRFAMESAFVEIGLQRIPIGALAIGEEKQVDIRLDPLLMPRTGEGNKKLSPEERLEQLKENVISFSRENKLRVIGVNTEPLPLLSMQEPHLAHYWNVVHQTVRLEADEKGMVTYPYGLLGISVSDTSGDVDSNSPYLWELGKGSITFELDAAGTGLKVERLTVPLDHSSFRPFHIEVFSQRTGKWIALKRGERLVVDKQLQEMMTPRGTLLLRFTHHASPRLTLPTPFFQVEGREQAW